MATKAKKTKQVAPVITAYKGFDANWKCRDFQYAVGETYNHESAVKACSSGFHACENPLDVFSYYSPTDSKFAKVTLSGEFSREAGGDSKVATGSITIGAEISIPTLASEAVKWVMAQLTTTTPMESASGDHSAATNTGNQSAATNTGYRSAATVEGKKSVAIACGIMSKAKASIGGAIVLCAHDDDGKLLHIRASLVGGNGVNPDVYYTLSRFAEFVEVI